MSAAAGHWVKDEGFTCTGVLNDTERWLCQEDFFAFLWTSPLASLRIARPCVLLDLGREFAEQFGRRAQVARVLPQSVGTFL